MSSKPFLHEHPSFKEIIKTIVDQTGILPQLVEKDYWLMHVLWALQDNGFRYELKGGTSLSKGWNIINRFSEDVDIKIFPPDGMKVYSSKNHDKPRHRENRKAYFAWLLETIKIPGAAYLNRDTDFDDHDLRNAGYRVGYQSTYEPYEVLKTDVLLEVGFDTTTPNQPHDISSWAYELGIKGGGLEIQDNRARAVFCYLPEYTFVEKLSAISKKYRQDVAGKNVQNFTRHYYDIYQLLGEPRVQTFIGTKEYFDHKAARFSKNDEADIKINPAFTLPDLNIRAKYANRLIQSSGLYFKGQPKLEEILERLEQYLDRL